MMDKLWGLTESKVVFDLHPIDWSDSHLNTHGL